MSEPEKVPSPAATGGAGEHFEQQIDAFALALLLVGAVPPVLTNTSTDQVSLQTRHLGWLTDDLLLIGKTKSGTSRKLAIQVKRKFSILSTNEDCQKTFKGFWDDFNAADRFNEATDRLAIVVQYGTETLLRHFDSLLQCAHGAEDAGDFFHRLSLDEYLSKEAKKHNDSILKILTDHLGKRPGDNDYWRFLKVVNLLNYDLNTASAHTESTILNLLVFTATDSQDAIGTARTTWSTILEIVSKGRPIAETYNRKKLPVELQNLHTAIPSTATNALRALINHGHVVRNSIKVTIGDDFEIDRSAITISMLQELEEDQVLLVVGAAGSGKSALAEKLLKQIEDIIPVFAFRAEEFAVAHINETLAKSQSTLNADQLQAVLSGHSRIVILVESIERLLEHTTREAFSDLLQIAKDRKSIQIILTCRDYSADTVRSALLESQGIPHSIHNVLLISDGEIQVVKESIPNLCLPLENPKLCTFLRTPYLLDMASRLDWSEDSTLECFRSFRQRCWKEIVREDHFTSNGMPHRRETVFSEIARNRAMSLSPYVKLDSIDAEALNALEKASLILRPPGSHKVYAVAHDVLEDWAIIHWLDEQYSTANDPAEMLADCISGYPALRRGLRQLLDEQFEINPQGSKNFVFDVLQRPELPTYFKDDCLVSALLSEHTEELIAECNERAKRGDTTLLIHIIHMLRVGCKTSPKWSSAPGLPSMMLVPAGPGWAATLELVANNMQILLPDHMMQILGFVEDWAKQVAWYEPQPDGLEETGRIVEALIPHLGEYQARDLQKRVLEVALKIPKAVPSLVKLLKRAEDRDKTDPLARELADLVLGGLSSGFVCRDHPDEVISLANARLRVTEAEIRDMQRYSVMEVNEAFGIREYGVSSFFPASDYQGPFPSLLRYHPQKAVTFIVDLLNHAGDWYGNRRLSDMKLEEAWQISLDVPDSEPVQQWMNGRLYGMYRGMSVGPYALQSALMALESWLLDIAKRDDIDLEAWLLYLLRSSNNVMTTAVVASVCIAHPEKSGKAGLALLSSREIIQCDLSRIVQEAPVMLEAFYGLTPASRFHENTRKQSNRLQHRRESLENLAVKLQFTDLRESVWGLIDHHRSKLPTTQDEDTQIWRLALHRIDARGFEPKEVPTTTADSSQEGMSKQIVFELGNIEPDIQQMVDESSESQAISERHVKLLNQAKDVWEKSPSQDSYDWRALLHEAQAIEKELEEPEEYLRGGPGYVASILARSHIAELDEDTRKWCAKRIELEVQRDGYCTDNMTRYSKGALQSDRAAASVVPLLTANNFFSDRILLALALTHPVKEVEAYTYSGVGAFLGTRHKDIALQCVATAAYQARHVTKLWSANEKLDFPQRTPPAEIYMTASLKARRAIESGGSRYSDELLSFSFEGIRSSQFARNIISVFEHQPSWEESQQFFSRVAVWFAEIWITRYEERRHDENRDFEYEAAALNSLAKFVLKLPFDKARKICMPLINCVDSNAHETADFLRDLIHAADGSTGDCFWELWREFADKTISASWIKSLERDRPYEESFVKYMFLNTLWKEDVKHWARLDGHSECVNELTKSLPPSITCLKAYSEFLFSIGSRSLPDAFKIVASLLERGNKSSMASNSEIVYLLENLLLRFIYSKPQLLKSNPEIRNAVLVILDALIAGGSPSAYRMRDDFITPIVTGS